MNVRDKLNVNLEYVHCRGNVERPKRFSDNQIECLMSMCDIKSKEVIQEVSRIKTRKELNI